LISYLKKYCLLLCLFFAAVKSTGQYTISGTVYDSSKVIPVKDVLVKTNNGNAAKTDSAGHYAILVNNNDSIVFIYHNKATEKFAAAQIKNTENFDISLHIHINGKFKTLKEVIVYSKSYQEDSAENREDYAKDFDYEKPGIKTTSSDYSGGAGLDLDEFINIFRFRRNKEEASFQKRLIEDEQDKYVSYRFNKNLVRRITKLNSPELDTFMVRYRPPFYFVKQSSLPEFYQYILDASYQFIKDMQGQKKKEEQPN
jgi:hypothetical protein